MNNMASFLRPSQPAKGLTLLEVGMATLILALAITGTMGAFTVGKKQSFLVREEAVALAAAQEILEEMRSTPFDQVYFQYQGLARPVFMAGDRVDLQRLGIGGSDELEVIIVTSEMPNEADYGRDLDGDGAPDGVDLNGNGSTNDVITVVNPVQAFPLDLNGNAQIEADPAGDCSGDPGSMRILPVVVLVRWRSNSGLLGRVQLIAFITDRGARL
jgi:type II secretory pathway pseudopilin PulG